MKKALLLLFAITVAFSPLFIPTSHAQEGPSDSDDEYYENLPDCPESCYYSGGSFHIVVSGNIVVKGGSPGGGGRTAGTGGDGGPSGPGGSSEPGVEPMPGPGGPGLPAILGGLGGLFGGGRQHPGGAGGVPTIGPVAYTPAGTSPALVQLPSLQPNPSVPGYPTLRNPYSGWYQSQLGEYVDDSMRLEERAAAWDFSSGSSGKATEVMSEILGSSASSAAARTETPTRIRNGQTELSTHPSPIYSGSGPALSTNVDTGIGSSGSDEGQISEKTFEWSKEAIDIGTDRTISQIERDIKNAERTMSSKQFAEYKKGAEDTKSVVSGLGKLLTAADYAADLKKVINADPGKNTQYETAKLVYKFGSDLAGTAAKKGIATVTVAVFPKIGPLLVDLGGIALTTVQISFGSEEIAKDPAEIVRDKSGQYSLDDKRKALAQELKWYNQLTKEQQAALKADLLEQIRIISEEQKSIDEAQKTK